MVYTSEGIEISQTLEIRKSVSFKNVTRTIASDLRAVYTPTDYTVTLRRGNFAGTLLRIAADTEIVLENLSIEGGEGTAVEVYGSLTVAGGKIEGGCAVRVCAPKTRAVPRASGGNATLYITGTPVLGTVRLDDPAGTISPCVNLEGFKGSVTVEISETRPYGVFVTGVGTEASLTVQGGERRLEGLSCREVRTENGTVMCGGYDLTVEQSELGEIVLRGACDEYLTSLEVTVNGETLLLSAFGGVFEAQTFDTGAENLVNLSVRGSETHFGLVSYDEKTGLLTAPENAVYEGEGEHKKLDGADPFALALGKDSATVIVDGSSRVLDFSRPVGVAFVFRYLTDDGVLFSSVNYTNFARIQAGAAIFEAMTARQQSVVDEKLADTVFHSFQELLNALDDYLAAQNGKADEFLDNNVIDFASVTGKDRDFLNSARADYLEAGDEARYFLDETAKEEGYSGFCGMVEDLIAKSEFEEEREETLENLGTILRGCDGTKVRAELSLVLETVKAAVYERCTEDDFRLEYLAGKKDSLKTAVRVLENVRAKERGRSALEDYVTKAREGGRYSDEALKELSEILEEIGRQFDEVDPEAESGGEQLGKIYEEGLARLSEVRAQTVSSGDFNPAALPEYAEGEIAALIGYLANAEGFRGDSSLSILLRPAGKADGDFVALFGVKVLLTGEEFGSETKLTLLLPETARGYVNYCVKLVLGGTKTVSAETEGNALIFSLDELRGLKSVSDTAEVDEIDFLVLAQKKVDLTWLIVLLSLLCALETAVLLYLVRFFHGNRAASLAAPLLAVILPASAVYVCAALSAVCLAEGIAIALLVGVIVRRK